MPGYDYFNYDSSEDRLALLEKSWDRSKNLVACALLKEIHYRADCYGEEQYLYYLKNKDGKELDFCITDNQAPKLLIEVKWSDEKVSPNFKIFQKFFPKVKMMQIVKNLKREKTFPNGVEVRSAHRWLSMLNLPVL